MSTQGEMNQFIPAEAINHFLSRSINASSEESINFSVHESPRSLIDKINNLENGIQTVINQNLVLKTRNSRLQQDFFNLMESVAWSVTF